PTCLPVLTQARGCKLRSEYRDDPSPTPADVAPMPRAPAARLDRPSPPLSIRSPNCQSRSMCPDCRHLRYDGDDPPHRAEETRLQSIRPCVEAGLPSCSSKSRYPGG